MSDSEKLANVLAETAHLRVEAARKEATLDEIIIARVEPILKRHGIVFVDTRIDPRNDPLPRAIRFQLDDFYKYESLEAAVMEIAVSIHATDYVKDEINFSDRCCDCWTIKSSNLFRVVLW